MAPPTPTSAEMLVPIGNGLGILELILHPCVVTLSLANLSILLSTRILHPNLRLILVAQSLCIALYESQRWTMVLLKFTAGDIFRPGDQFLQSLSIFGNIFRNSIGHVLLLERILACAMARRYEQWKRPYFAIVWLLILLIFCGLNVLTNGQSWTTTLLNLLSNSFLQLCTLFEIFAISVIGWQSMKKYNRIVPNTKDYSLSEKFQIGENIRTSRQLAPLFLFHFANNVLYAILNTVLFSKVFADQPQMTSLSYAVILSLMAMFEAAIEITVITHHPLLKRKMSLRLRRIFSCFSSNPSRARRVGHLHQTVTNGHAQPSPSMHSLESLTDIHGTRLINSASADGHFRMLGKLWN